MATVTRLSKSHFVTKRYNTFVGLPQSLDKIWQMKKALTWVNILTFSYHQTRNSVSKHAPNPVGLRCRPLLLGS